MKGFGAIEPFGPVMSKIFPNVGLPIFGWVFVGYELLYWPIFITCVGIYKACS